MERENGSKMSSQMDEWEMEHLLLVPGGLEARWNVGWGKLINTLCKKWQACLTPSLS